MRRCHLLSTENVVSRNAEATFPAIPPFYLKQWKRVAATDEFELTNQDLLLREKNINSYLLKAFKFEISAKKEYLIVSELCGCR